jgi:hypothetical protein
MSETLEQKKARLLAERDKIKKRLRQLDAKESAARRKEETRLKVVVGAIVLKAAKEGRMLSPADAVREAQKALVTEAQKRKVKAPVCECGATCIRGKWKNQIGQQIEGWHCPSAFLDGRQVPGHLLKGD